MIIRPSRSRMSSSSPRQGARPVVGDAQRPEGVAVDARERDARVGLQPEVAGDQRVALGVVGLRARPGCTPARRSDDRGAEPGVAPDLAGVEPEVRLEPDPVPVDDAHRRDRHVEHARGERRDAVEGALRRRVEQVVAVQRREPRLLVGRRAERRVEPPVPARSPSAMMRRKPRRARSCSAGPPGRWRCRGASSSASVGRRALGDRRGARRDPPRGPSDRGTPARPVSDSRTTSDSV